MEITLNDENQQEQLQPSLDTQENQTEPSFPPHPKWDSSKNVKYFEGNSLVCMIPPSSPQYGLLKAAQSIVKNSSIAKYYGFLPPSSFHMTVFDLLSDSNGRSWIEIHKEMFKKCQNILRSASWTTFKMEFETVIITPMFNQIEDLTFFLKKTFNTLGQRRLLHGCIET